MSLNFWNEKTTNVIPISSAFSFSFSSSYSLWYLLSLRRGIFSLAMVILKYYCGIICDALRDLVPFVQFKKCEKHPTLLKSDTPPWAFFTFCNCTNGFKLRKASHFMSESFCNFVSCHLQDANSKELILTTAKNFPQLHLFTNPDQQLFWPPKFFYSTRTFCSKYKKLRSYQNIVASLVIS